MRWRSYNQLFTTVLLSALFFAELSLAATSGSITQPSTTTKAPTVTTAKMTNDTQPTTTATTETITVTDVPPPTTTAPLTTTTMAPPRLGDNCTDNECSNNEITGEAVCLDGKCACAEDYFQLNSTECLSVSTLEPNLKIQDSDGFTTSFACSWTFSDVRVNDLALVFNVTARSEGVGVGKETKDCDVGPKKTANCTDLTPGTKYNVTLEVTYGGYTKFSSGEGITFPAQPGEISATTFKESANITWIQSNGKVDLYTISVDGDPRNTTTKTQFYYDGLDPARRYHVTIVACSNTLKSVARNDSFRTQPDVPQPPTNPIVLSKTNTTVKLQWDEPEHSNGDILTYQVCYNYRVYSDQPYMNGKCSNASGTQRNLTLVGLIPGAFYKFEIYTINELTISEANVSIENRTEETVPGKVDQLEVASGNKSLNAMWQRPTSPNGDIIAYQIQWQVTGDNSSVCSVMLNTTDAMTTNAHAVVNCSDKTYSGHTVAINQENMSYEIEDLQDYEEYTVQVTAFTIVGPGTPEVVQERTSVAKPKAVTNVQVTVTGSTSVNVSWTLPGDRPGPVNYTVLVTDVILKEKIGASCNVTDMNLTSCEVDGLDEYWPYSFEIEAQTSAGSAFTQLKENKTTEEAAPGKVTEVSFEPINGTNCDATSIILKWVEPPLRDRNSRIVQYKLLLESNNASFNNYSVPNPKPYDNRSRSFSDKVEGFTPESIATYKIYAVSEGKINGQTTNLIVETGACAPPKWESGKYPDITSQSKGTSRVTIWYPLEFFTNTQQGAIIETGVLVANAKEKLVSADKIKDVGTWRLAKDSNFDSVYKVHIESASHRRRKRSDHLKTFEIGANDSCTINTDKAYFCNGPLPDDFPVYIAAYACTSVGCTRSEPFGPFRTVKIEPDDPASKAWLAAVIVLALIAITLTVVLALMYFRGVNPKTWFQKKQQPSSRKHDEELSNPIFDIPKNRPMSLSKYDDHLDDLHRDTNLLFSDQYGDINKLSEQITQNSSFDNANLEANKAKNRWVNILPYDHSRVKLQQLDEDDQSSDYINANYIPGFNNRREYIATQGPLPGTVDDFWRMVWEHNVQVIVMLTQCKEGNRVKCEKYWPDEVNEPKQYGDIVVNPTSKSLLSKYCITIFEVSMNNQKRQVLHFHYLHFPDFSANVEFDVFIDFVQTVRSHVPHDMVGPIVVHCSAGVGRTGSFIGVDRLDQYIRSRDFTFDDTVDIFGMVMSMRENRVLMVQTESQYIMIHDCLKLLLDAKKEAMEQEDLYINEAFDPYPEVLYENVNPRNGEVKTEL